MAMDLGLNIADINNDGWKDIYVTNDFFGNDLLYINNHDGTFTNKAKDYFKHTSQNAMGNDIADINNDGLPDVVAVDMDPEDNFRKKKNMDGNNYYLYQRMMSEGLIIQYVRNTLQLNMGPRVLGTILLVTRYLLILVIMQALLKQTGAGLHLSQTSITMATRIYL